MAYTRRSTTTPPETDTRSASAGPGSSPTASNAAQNEALRQAGPGADSGSLLDEVRPTAELSPEVDAHLATITSLIVVTQTISGPVLVDTARDLDARLRSGEIRGPRHRAAAAAKLLEIARELQRRIDEAPLGPDAVPEVEGLAWNPDSPNVGLLEDIAPFGAMDEWAAIAESAPAEPAPRRRRRRAPPEPEPASEPSQPSRSGHQGAVDGHTWNAEHTGGAQGRGIGGELRREVDEAGGTAGAVGQVADVLGMLQVPFLDVAAHIVSYVAFVTGEHQREVAQARVLGGRIAGHGLITISNTGDYVPNLSPRGLRRGATVGGGPLPRGWQQLQVLASQVPDRVLEQNIDAVLQRTCDDVGARLEVVERRAREHGLGYEERERVKQTYIRSVGTAILERL